MTDMTIALIVIAWLACGVMSYGIIFAYFQGMWPHLAERDLWRDRCFAAINIPLGPIGLIATLMTTRGLKYGWRL